MSQINNYIDDAFFNPEPTYRNIKTGAVSNKIYDVLDNSSLELYPPKYIIKNIERNYKVKNCNAFIFKNILSIPYVEYQHESIKNLYCSNKPLQTVPLDFFVQELTECLYQTILKAWNPDHLNVVLHSSGYDSRIISFLIKRIEREGIKLGEFKFFCYGKESKFFKKIMKHEGWNRNNYIAKLKTSEKFRFDFSNCYKITNGSECDPVHSLGLYSHFAVNSLDNKHKKKIVIWTGRFFTEIFNLWPRWTWSYDGNFMNFCDEKLFNSRFAQVSVFPAERIVFPALGYRVFEFLSNNYVEPTWREDKNIEPRNFISKKICQTLDKDLFGLTRYMPKCRVNISGKMKKKVRKQYKKSWYGKYLRNNLKLNRKSSGWCHWTCAGMIEDVIKNNK